MDLLAGLIPFLKGLLASTLVLLSLVITSTTQLLASFSSYQAPQMQVSDTSLPAPQATTTARIKTSTATTTPKIPVKKTQPVAVTPVPVTAQKTSATPLISGDEVNTLARASIVNILCLTSSGSGVRSISGSGVIIDARGIILTNAHIGQYFVLEDALQPGAIDCTIRTGSPATPLYRASLIYLPPQWIDANASQITAEQAVGTGEYDYAFLHIDSTTNPNGTLPISFPNIAMSGVTPVTGDQVLVAGYPAGFLDGLTIERNLYATSAFTQIGPLYTFDDPTHVDVVSLGGTVVSQGGSSGGAVVRNYDGELTGLIATATAGTTTAQRDLRAITIGYINRSLTASGKGGLAEFLSEDIAKTAEDFSKNIEPQEKQKLLQALGR